ncbi:hypothetical protein E2A64_05575 [Pseudohoeflea suaedae]|uniref:Uncharacterized protein n=1 Tax=Pseudohoeflea suaedae TaxID=877384 RepID=A0A4R5PPH8_9HYPH|nr:hypothetical protein [Pseudohoeflea suaedae]TDH38571.1 hypothetical protein E2A64_05575 [Pseudohoeflea suaedae]
MGPAVGVQNRISFAPKDADAAAKVFANATALARELGISERQIGLTALTVALTIAEAESDPDGYLASLVALSRKDKP